MPPDGPTATPAPIHDIVGPVPILESPIWWITAGVVATGLLAFLAFMIVGQLRRPRELSPRERALVDMAGLHGVEIPPYQLAVELSDILRIYLEEAFGIRATTATSLEFLESIHNNPLFSEQEKQSLADFLETTDLLKFGRVEVGQDEAKKLLRGAEEIARGSLSHPPADEESKGETA
jgi:hypothetical protein